MVSRVKKQEIAVLFLHTSSTTCKPHTPGKTSSKSSYEVISPLPMNHNHHPPPHHPTTTPLPFPKTTTPRQNQHPIPPHPSRAPYQPLQNPIKRPHPLQPPPSPPPTHIPRHPPRQHLKATHPNVLALIPTHLPPLLNGLLDFGEEGVERIFLARFFAGFVKFLLAERDGCPLALESSEFSPQYLLLAGSEADAGG